MTIKNVRIRPVSTKLSVSKFEIHRALACPQNTHELGNCAAPTPQSRISHLVGIPLFQLSRSPQDDMGIVPVGQIDSALAFLASITSKKQTSMRLRAEYQAAIEALLGLGINFRILNAERGDKEIVQWLDEKGCRNIKFPAKHISRWLLYPRDMFVFIKSLDVLLVHSELFKLRTDWESHGKIIHTRWAEGGRILLSEDRMLVGILPEERIRPPESDVLDELRALGMRIGQIPCGLSFGVHTPSGRKCSLFYDSHIDRSACLLKGRKGDFHVVLGSGYRTGELVNPLSEKKSIDLVRKASEGIEAQVHVSEGNAVPLSTSVIQFDDGRVLATCGDESFLSIVGNIVGFDNLCVTDIPIAAYPVFAAAGLHCLITESPEPLVCF